MDPNEIYHALKRSRLTSSLDNEHLTALLGLSRKRLIPAGRYLYREGEPGDSLAIILKGAMRAEVEARDGEPQFLSELEVGDVVGEMACLDPAARAASVFAEEDSVVMEISGAMLNIIIERAPAVGSRILRGITEEVTHRIRETNDKIRVQGARLAAREAAPDQGKPRKPWVRPAKARGREYAGALNLASIPCLSRFSQADLEIIRAATRCAVFEPGDYLCTEGEPGTSCYIIAVGKVDVLKRTSSGDQLLTRLEKSVVGQMALVEPLPRSATLRCTTEVVLLELDRDRFQRLLVSTSPIAIQFQREIAVAGIRQIREANRRLLLLREQINRLPPPGKVRSRQEEKSLTSYQKTLAYMETSLKMWGMDSEDLNNIKISRPAVRGPGGRVRSSPER